MALAGLALTAKAIMVARTPNRVSIQCAYSTEYQNICTVFCLHGDDFEAGQLTTLPVYVVKQILCDRSPHLSSRTLRVY
jgi:hypothetical protein